MQYFNKLTRMDKILLNKEIIANGQKSQQIVYFLSSALNNSLSSPSHSTEANVSAQEEGAEGWKGGEGGVGSRRGSRLGTSESGQFPMQNGGRVKFDPPKVPVIFVLGMFRSTRIFYPLVDHPPT